MLSGHYVFPFSYAIEQMYMLVIYYSEGMTQLTFTCSKSTTETVDKGAKCVHR